MQIHLLDAVELLIEQTNNNNQGKMLAQNLAVGGGAAIGTNILLRNTLKDRLVGAGLNGSNNVAGLPLTSTADIGTGVGMGVAGMAVGGLAKKVLQKYQEKKYGVIAPQDNRTAGQKTTDRSLAASKLVANGLLSTGVKAAAGVGLNALTGSATAATTALTGGASILAAVPLIAATNYIANRTTNKVAGAVQQKIQQKRQAEQEQQQQQAG